MNIIHRKFRKLVKSPEKFFQDMISKKKRQVNTYLQFMNKRYGYYSYSIVSACYNVEKYLDDYFNSIKKQTLSFKNNIYCIMVDDGSTDGTANIIKKWQSRYPKNIRYIYKENGGQASARNLGMQYVDTPWVTFADPDDFFDPQYFSCIDDFLCKNKSICMVGAHMIFYREWVKIFSDSHPLNFKFKNAEAIVPVVNLDKEIQLSAATVIFKTEYIQKIGLEFDDRVKPNFEDAHFVARYLINYPSMNVAFLAKAKYYYRKRKDKTSTLDKSWRDKKKFFDVFKYGKIDILKKYNAYKFIQNTCLYDIMWHIRYLINSPEKVIFLTDKEKNDYFNLLVECFSYIDEETILKFSLAGCWFYHKLGILNCFKQIRQTCSQIVYIEDFDVYKKELKIRYFTGNQELEEFIFDKTEVLPTHAKRIRDDFLGRTFIYQRIIWIPVPDIFTAFTCRINGENARITLRGKQYPSISYQDMSSYINTFIKYKDNAPWILMDREIQADDNAEHLYRYIKKSYPEENIYFVLRRDSHDWNRLFNEGFKLLAYGSQEHEQILRSASKIISSHIDGYVVNYFKDSSTEDKQIVFLQHGIIKDDLSRWLNTKKRIDLFITETQNEYNSIVNNDSRYKLTDKEVKLLGLPRHDVLFADKENHRRILVMPTWRHYLMGKQISGNIREKNTDFMQSEYAMRWRSFLTSSKLRELLKTYGYEVVFFPHSNIQPYLSEFVLPDYIQVIHHYDGSIQGVFKNATIMVTDYSSVAFEMAYLQKLTCYYQFDESTIFNGEHIYQKGYFDYRKDGFGPVAIDEESLFINLEGVLRADGKPSEEYLRRMNETFIFHDGKNCERVYQAIRNLDHPNPEGYINRDIVAEAVDLAIRNEKWIIAEQRAQKFHGIARSQQSESICQLCRFRANIETGHILEAERIAAQKIPANLHEEYLALWQEGLIRLAMLRDDPKHALTLLQQEKNCKDREWLIVNCLSSLNLPYNESLLSDQSKINQVFSKFFLCKDWKSALLCVEELQEEADHSIQLCVLICHAARCEKNWHLEGLFRKKIENRKGRNIDWRMLAAFRSSEDGRSGGMEDARLNLERAFNSAEDMPSVQLSLYCTTLLHTKNDKLDELWDVFCKNYRRNILLPYYARFKTEKKLWKEAIPLWQEMMDKGLSYDWGEYAFCLKNAGLFEDALNMLNNSSIQNEELLRLKSELYEYFCDYKNAETTWREIAKYNPDTLHESIVHIRSIHLLSIGGNADE